MHSFVECLRSVCRDIKPRRIIEWGPGKSTAVLREECGEDAIIISVEHNPKYAKMARETNHANHVFEFDAACYKSRYAVWPLASFDKEQRFDLAFVDGRRRVECALVAWMILREGGALVMHDAHRWHYSLVMRHYLGEPEGGASVDAYLLDSYSQESPGGTGKTCDWNAARAFVLQSPKKVLLAGGLTPENVREAIERVGPWGVDVSSGVEERPGRKDLAKVGKFIERCRS